MRTEADVIWVDWDKAESTVYHPEIDNFDPATGNRIRIDFDSVKANYVKVVFTMNSSSRTGGAQAAEIAVYE